MRHQAASDDEALVSAAKAGDANAAFRLYELSEQRGDHRDAERWLGRAADDGHAEALYRLAQPESNGEMSRKHLNMMRQAAAAGHADAMYAMARYFERQFIINNRKGTDDSPGWYRQAADADHVPAMRTMARYASREGRAVEAVGWWRRAENARGSDGPEWSWALDEEIDAMAQEADAGQPDALYRFAKLTRLTTDDRQTMLRCMLRATEAGSPEASLAFAELAHFLMDDTHNERQQVLDCYRRAVDRGMAQAMVGVGDLGPSHEAASWYEKAAAAGCSDGFARLGDLAAHRYDNNEAMACWTNAAAMNSSAAMWRLYQQAEDRDAATAWLRRAAEAGHLRAMDEMVQRADAGGAGAEAQQWRERIEAERPCLPYKPKTKGFTAFYEDRALGVVVDILNLL